MERQIVHRLLEYSELGPEPLLQLTSHHPDNYSLTMKLLLIVSWISPSLCFWKCCTLYNPDKAANCGRTTWKETSWEL